jgi:hypothetical protein
VTNHERVTEEGEASRRHNMSSAERAILPHGFVMQKNMAKGKFPKGGGNHLIDSLSSTE